MANDVYVLFHVQLTCKLVLVMIYVSFWFIPKLYFYTFAFFNSETSQNEKYFVKIILFYFSIYCFI